MGSWNQFRKMNARRPKVFVVARDNPADAQMPLALQMNGTWGAWQTARHFRKEELAKATAEAATVKLGVRVWTVDV